MRTATHFLVGRPLPVQAPSSFVRLRPAPGACGVTRPISRARCCARPAWLPRQ